MLYSLSESDAALFALTQSVQYFVKRVSTQEARAPSALAGGQARALGVEKVTKSNADVSSAVLQTQPFVRDN